MPDVTIQPVEDTVLNKQNQTFNYSSATELFIGGAHLLTGALFSRWALLEFDLTALSGALIDTGMLYMTVSSDGGGANNGEHPHLAARRILRDDVVLTEATWDIYKTGSNWGGGGATEIGTDTGSTQSTGDDMQSNTPGTVYTVDIAALLNEAITESDARLVIVVFPSEFTASQNVINLASMEHATTGWRPYLEITYRVGGLRCGFLRMSPT